MKLERRLWFYYLLPYRAVFERGKSLVKSNFRALTAFWLQFGITVLITAYQVIPQTSEHDHLSQGKPDLKANFQQSLLVLPNSSNKYRAIIISDTARDLKQRLELCVLRFLLSFLYRCKAWLLSRTSSTCPSELLVEGSACWGARLRAAPLSQAGDRRYTDSSRHKPVRVFRGGLKCMSWLCMHVIAAKCPRAQAKALPKVCSREI